MPGRALDGVIDPVVQNELMSGVDWLVEATSRWWLVQGGDARLMTISPRVSVTAIVRTARWRNRAAHKVSGLG